MARAPYAPWHQVVRLREDLRSGELALASFAADLYDVALDRGRSVYRDPAEFFALTYPTFNLRELAKDVLRRLAGRNDKAVRQLELTYGGGKSHALITLYHLGRDPEHLPDLPAVHEFRQRWAELSELDSRLLAPGALPGLWPAGGAPLAFSGVVEFFAEAALEPAELQDFVDGLSEVLKAGAGLDLRFLVRVEVPDGAATPEQIALLNEALAKVSAKLRLA